MEANKTPEIRFKDFNAAWEQRKLGSIAASFDYGLNAAATEYDGQNKYLRITDIDDTTHEFLKSDLTTPLADLAMSADYLLEEGDLLFARTGASVGKTYLYRQYDGTVYFAGFLIRARIGESADPEFVYQATLTDAYKKYVAITSQRSGQPGVNAQEYADYQLMLPSRTEQQRIGMTLRSLDNLITLHQRKCDKLVKLKSAMLNRMFPKPGDSEPEIRFGVFKEPWKRYKLGDVAAIARGERFTAADYVESGGIPCIHYGEIYTCYGTIATKTISQVSSSLKDSLRYAKKGDVIVAATSENVEDVCKAVVWMGNSPVAYHDDSFALTFSGDPIFLVSFFETSEFFAEKSSAAHGVKVMRVSSDSLADVDLPLPSTAEQRLIGGYFAKLDNLITLHRRKIKGLKKIKSAMLDKMSV